MDPDVSVVVPVFNPGPNIEICVDSLLAQTLAPERVEIILVDDGSTDGSTPRIEALATAHPDRITLAQIPNSGWPSRPRNIGIGMARGRYIQFVDNDDTLAPDALRRLLEVADSSAADLVIPRFASNFRGLNHWLFRETVMGRTLADFPLEYSLTPHKMFRREFLNEHNLRFVEGIRNLEDQIFCMQAYVTATSVALVADTLAYHYQQRHGPGRNAGTRRLDPGAYYDSLELVFDVIDANLADHDLRLRVYRRFYRDEMLRRLREDKLLGYEADYRQQMFDRIRDVADRRIPADLHDTMPALLRTQSRLFLDRDINGLVDYSHNLVDLTLVASCDPPQWDNGRLALRVRGHLAFRDQPFRLESHDGGWALPAAFAPGVPVRDRRLLDPTGEDTTELSLVSRSDGASWPTGADLELTIEADGSVRIRADATIDLQQVCGGQPLAPGLWDFKARVDFAGLGRTATLAFAADSEAGGTDPVAAPDLPAWLTLEGSVAPYWTNHTQRLALDVNEWMHPLVAKLARSATTATSRSDRSVVIMAPLLRGPRGHTIDAECVLQPTTKAAGPPLHCPAHLRLTPAGARIVIAVHRRSRPGARNRPRLENWPDLDGWTAWLRLGMVGANGPIDITSQSAAGPASSDSPRPG